MSSHPEDFCQQCQRPNVIWFAPSALWNKAVREQGLPEILCPVCFIQAAEKSGAFTAVWRVAPQGYNAAPAPPVAQPVAPQGRCVHGEPLTASCDECVGLGGTPITAAVEAAKEIVAMIEAEREPFPAWSTQARKKYAAAASQIISRYTAQQPEADSPPTDLIAWKWAETLSEGEQSVLLGSSLKRLEKMIVEHCASIVRAGDLGTDTAFPLSETLRLLVEWAQHLHDTHECDCHGWEQRSFLIDAAQRYQAEIKHEGGAQ